MLNGICSLFFKILFFLIRWLTNILLLPITLIFNAIFPDFSNFMSDCNYFINEYLFNAIAVGREVFLNVTGFPFGLIQLSVNMSIAILTAIGSLKLYSFIMNCWRRFKGG